MEQITENNKLIAEFMGATWFGHSMENPKPWWIINSKEYYSEDLKYHTSWDWLMPVVEKIGRKDCDHEPLAGVTLYSPIGMVYHAVVEFIKWYHENKEG